MTILPSNPILSGSPTKTLCISLVLHACHKPHPSYLPWFNHPNNNNSYGCVKIKNLHIQQFSPTSCYSPLLGPTFSTSTFKHPQHIFFPYPYTDWHSSKLHPEFQLLPQREQSQHHQAWCAACDIQGNNWFMMSISYKTLKYTVWQNADFLNVATGGIYGYHYGFKWICETTRSIWQ
jgi:hypothetical protein